MHRPKVYHIRALRYARCVAEGATAESHKAVV